MAEKKGELSERVGRAIRNHRERLHVSQEAYATHLEVDRARYARIERGEANLALGTVEDLARRMELEPRALMQAALNLERY